MLQSRAVHIIIKGVVQGVGFRPFIFAIAKNNQLTGWVRNTSSGVEIEIQGSQSQVDQFIIQLRSEAPPLSRIDFITIENITPGKFSEFTIQSSLANPNDFQPISPDTSICPDCLQELFSEKDKRYRYPFINCTNCGPRFTIIKDIPYDRPSTTMVEFEMCEFCRREYTDPLNRRFHAQPVACPDCGPQVQYIKNGAVIADKELAIQMARQDLQNGLILAIKGIGGYHLACDATNPLAIGKLRDRKKRSDKPFALMSFSTETIEKYSMLSPSEKNLLTSRERPVILLNRLSDTAICDQVAPGQNTLGFMLPYTPLHYLLLEPADHYPEVLVMTSGNISDEPIAYDDAEAFQRLSTIADSFLIHNRAIHMRMDDSVIRSVDERLYLIRRSRGYAPNSLALPFPVPNILATGAELKNTFCLTRDQYAFLSHHIGDLENLETLQSFEEGIQHFEKLFRIKPEMIGCDLHPNYLATRYALERAQTEHIPVLTIQHHHAHLAACMADNQWETDDPVIGLCYDGTGLGTDQAIWGGEVLVGGYQKYQRRFHLKYTPLPGGDLAIKYPSRMALSYLWNDQYDWDLEIPSVSAQCYEDRTALKIQLERKINSPLTSSMGRFFDAAASLMGIRHNVTYEGQAAIEMEVLCDPNEMGEYPISLVEDELDPHELWQNLIQDVLRGTPIPKMASRFHNSVAFMSLSACEKIRNEQGVSIVALSGGVWQNKVLLSKTIKLLKFSGFQVLVHHNVPTNDGGISFGQACITARVLKNS
jgi:hydrogenase maturation protein HypF